MDLRQMIITVFVEEILYSLTLPLIKISILFLYHSLFPGKFMKLSCYVLGAFTVAWAIAILLVTIFSCEPIHGFWDGFMMNPPPKCINNTNFFIGNSVSNIIADIAILCLPVREVLHLKMTAKTKAAVLSMFLLGGL